MNIVLRANIIQSESQGEFSLQEKDTSFLRKYRIIGVSGVTFPEKHGNRLAQRLRLACGCRLYRANVKVDRGVSQSELLVHARYFSACSLVAS